jgi:carbamoyl-phosphate synthase large subunit
MKRWRLLITDPGTPQSYDIMRALSDQCERIIVTVRGKGIVPGVFSFSSLSRLTAKTYRIKTGKSPACCVSTLNESACAAEEKEYIDDILDICRRERINLIYPSGDEEVFILAKYKKVFAKRGVFIPVNDYPVLKRMADKFTIIQLAREQGLACPGTFLVEDAEMLGFPETGSADPVAVVKPRFGSASRGICFLKNRRDFDAWREKHKARAHEFVVQEYIPGDTITYVRVYMKPDATPFLGSCAVCQRPEMAIHQNYGLLLIKKNLPAYFNKIVSLFASEQFIGYGHVQLKVDARDDLPKVMEVNVRISEGTWSEVREGVNGPLISLSLFENKAIALPVSSDKAEVVFVWPVRDICIFIFYLFLRVEAFFKEKLLSGKKTRKLPPVSAMLKHYYDIYFSRRRRVECDNYFKFFLRDPLVSLAHWSSFCSLLNKVSRKWEH